MEYKSPKPLPVGNMVIMSLSQRFRLNITRDSAGEASSFYFILNVFLLGYGPYLTLQIG